MGSRAQATVPCAVNEGTGELQPMDLPGLLARVSQGTSGSHVLKVSDWMKSWWMGMVLTRLDVVLGNLI